MTVSVVAPLSLVALLALVGCGAATPGAVAPGQEATVHVVAPVVAPAATKKDGQASGTRAAAEEGEMGEVAATRAARAAVLREAAEFGLEGLLDSGAIPTSVFGGSVGGVLGGTGGLGLSGVGIGGGGTGIGIGSMGTIGTGTGYGIGSSRASSYSSPVSGQSVIAGPTSVIEIGDAATLGVSLDVAVRLVRERVYRVRDCYEDRLSSNPTLAGSLALRVVLARDGRVALTRDLGSDLADPVTFTCIAKVFEGVFVGVPAGGDFGVIETVLRFRRAPKK